MKRLINNMSTGTALFSLFAGVGAVVASASCCVLPLMLSAVGFGGAWLGELSAVSVYKPYVLGAAAVALALGWIAAFHRRRACVGSEICASQRQKRLIFSTLGLSTLTVATAAGWSLIESSIMAVLARLAA